MADASMGSRWSEAGRWLLVGSLSAMAACSDDGVGQGGDGGIGSASTDATSSEPTAGPADGASHGPADGDTAATDDGPTRPTPASLRRLPRPAASRFRPPRAT